MRTSAVPDSSATPGGSKTQKFLFTSQLKSLYSRATVKFETAGGNPSKINIKANGTVSGQVNTTNRVNYDDGRWWLKEPNLIWNYGDGILNFELR